MEFGDLLKRLRTVRFFEGYSPAAARAAIEEARKRHAEGIAGLYRADFERFPALALVVIGLDHELTGWDDLQPILKQLGESTFGSFVPKNIRIRRRTDEDHYHLGFTVNGARHSLRLPNDSWIPNEFFEQLDIITASECNGLAFHAVSYPEPSQSGYYLWCTPRALKALSRAQLIPSAKQPLRHGGDDSDSSEHGTGVQELVEPASTLQLAPPENSGRAVRSKLFKNREWIIPLLSADALEHANNLESPQSSALSSDQLVTHINRAFDLVCACHCGVPGLRAPIAYAEQVVALVERFLFDSPQPRNGNGELPPAVEPDQLYWSLGLPAGCVTATAIGNDNAAARFLGYLHGEVRSGPIGDELAFYRLFSDVFMEKTEWDVDKLTSIIAGGFDDRLKLKLQCLHALKTNDAGAFRKAVRKLAKRPNSSMTPLRYSNVVDCEVSLLVFLAGRRGWPCSDFPASLQDQVLDPSIFARDLSA